MIVTPGGRGARLVTRDAVVWIAPIRVTPVDTTSAGDAFIGSFAHFLAATGDVELALNRAARYAGHPVTGRGTQKSHATAGALDAFCRTLSETA